MIDADAFQRLAGRFIVFDGVDGAGKGAQIRRLTEGLARHKVDYVATRDPGGTVIGDRIRHVLLDYDLSEMDIGCEALLFMASRAQLVRDVVKPALKRRAACVCDRFVSATCAYQGAAGFDPRRVIELARFAIGDTWPHLTIVIDLPAEVGLDRTGRRPGPKKKAADVEGQVRLFHDTHADAMESRPLDFHQQVRELFLQLPTYYPGPVAIVDGRGTEDEVQARVMKAVLDAPH